MAAQDLTTLAAVRARLELPASDTSRDTLISALITSASDAIIREVEREFAPVTASATRRFEIRPGRRVGVTLMVSLAPYDLRSVSAMTLNPESLAPTTLVATTDYILWPTQPRDTVYTAVAIGSNVSVASTTLNTFGFAYLDIAGAWGFASVPTDVAEACIDTVRSWLRRDSVAYGADVADMGGISPVADGTYSIPRAALKKLQPYRRSPVY